MYQTIITSSDLAENIDSPNWLILDCRANNIADKESYYAYLESHIPNAFYTSLVNNSFSDTEDKSERCTLSDFEKMITSLYENGFDKNTQIIIYDNDNSEFTDLFWLKLRTLGFQCVAVLQGGFTAWLEQEMPLTTHKAQETTLAPNQIHHSI